MDFLGSKLLGMGGIQKAHMQTTEATHEQPRKRDRYTGVSFPDPLLQMSLDG